MNIQQFSFSVDILKALLWNQNNAQRLRFLLEKKQTWYNSNQTQFWDDWFFNVFNLDTANDFGLDVWGNILNLPLQVFVEPDPPGKPVFGFGQYRKNFNNGNFGVDGQNINLSTEEKRILLKLRYFQLTTRTAIPECNRFLNRVFKNFGSVYILDGLDMSIVAVFKFNINRRFLKAIKDYDLIPRASGVGISYVITTAANFGFDQYRKNFNNGNFFEA